ncbi:UNKNOWN [Stylonychia lemnae]|uniref:Uncharacterized protein n=1 Tax=Stylonychia lemnae TaxID=5949 RepID=A0A078A4P2_STYLE|nr:UNKNOWN [Stylonychia lemnae]|eukprot:CDW76473.1 UNKNOWN [Stylonychia lemnae]
MKLKLFILLLLLRISLQHIVTYTVSNPNPYSVDVLKSYTLLEGLLSPQCLTVKYQNRIIPYDGVFAKRALLHPRAYLQLPPYASYSLDIDISFVYDLTKLGAYEVIVPIHVGGDGVRARLSIPQNVGIKNDQCYPMEPIEVLQQTSHARFLITTENIPDLSVGRLRASGMSEAQAVGYSRRQSIVTPGVDEFDTFDYQDGEGPLLSLWLKNHSISKMVQNFALAFQSGPLLGSNVSAYNAEMPVSTYYWQKYIYLRYRAYSENLVTALGYNSFPGTVAHQLSIINCVFHDSKYYRNQITESSLGQYNLREWSARALLEGGASYNTILDEFSCCNTEEIICGDQRLYLSVKGQSGQLKQHETSASFQIQIIVGGASKFYSFQTYQIKWIIGDKPLLKKADTAFQGQNYWKLYKYKITLTVQEISLLGINQSQMSSSDESVSLIFLIYCKMCDTNQFYILRPLIFQNHKHIKALSLPST